MFTTTKSKLALTFCSCVVVAACAFLKPKTGGSDDAEKEYQRKLGLFAVGQPCPENAAKMWGRPTAVDWGLVGMVDSNRSGALERTVWVGRKGEHAAALTCSGGTVVSKYLCGTQRCVSCSQPRDCPFQTCRYGRCQ
jgi:hypothetical protein